MIKILFGWRDHPERTAEECDRHYRSVHMPLARAAFDGVEGFHALVYNRVRRHFVNDFNQPEAIDRPTDMDAFVELYFSDGEALRRAFARPAMKVLFDDHPNFMDVDVVANVRAYEVEEVIFHGQRPPNGTTAQEHS